MERALILTPALIAAVVLALLIAGVVAARIRGRNRAGRIGRLAYAAGGVLLVAFFAFNAAFHAATS